VLVPGSIGVYTGGSTYNPAQVLRDKPVAPSTEKLDKLLSGITDKEYLEMPLNDLRKLITLTSPDQEASEKVWDAVAVGESIVQFGKLQKQDAGYVYVARDRGLKENRRETQGILEGGEAARVPDDKVTLFLLRTRGDGSQHAAWWPQIRFPDGRYAFAFTV
jgi:hypothetical protein